MAQKVTLRASGLYLNSNSLGTVPQGALLEANNVVIDKNDIIESRRGFKIYGSDLGVLPDNRAKQLLNYRDSLIRHYSDVLEHDSASNLGTFTAYKNLKWIYADTLTSVGTTATFVCMRPHQLVTGDVVTISGTNETAYNGSFAVTVTNSLTFTYTLPGATTSPATGDSLLEVATAHIDQVDANNKVRGVESFNSNFYFTSLNGVMKLDALDSYIVKAGGVKALDLDLSVGNANISGVLPEDSQLGYRIVWGYKDANNNLILGSPSQRATIALQSQDVAIDDFNTLLTKLDIAVAANGAAAGPNPLSDTVPSYASLAIPTTSSAADLNTALKALATKLELDMAYTFGGSLPARYGRSGSITGISTAASTVITSNAHNLSNGDVVRIDGSNSVPSIDGSKTVASRAANTFEIATTVTSSGASGVWESGVARNYPTPTTDTVADYETQQDFFNDIVNLLLAEPVSKITAAAQTAANLQNATEAKDVEVTFTVPQGVTTNDFYQIYRTLPSIDSGTDPGDEMGLVYEANPTATDIKAGTITVTDITPDDFRGADLYTNPNQEGIAQANERPPFAKDVAIFKNIAFFGNTRTLHQKQLSLLSVSDLIGTKILIDDVTYTFGASEVIGTGTIGVVTSGTPAQNVDATARSLVRVVNRYSQNITVNASYLSGPSDVPGQILFQARDLDNGAFYILSNSASVGAVNFNPNIAPDVSISAISVANPTEITTSAAHGLTSGNTVVIVGSNSTPSIDGSYTATVVSTTKFTIPVNVSGSGSTGFLKQAASSSIVASDDEAKKNRLYYSKQQQFEAVPLLNYFDVGSGDKDIKRVMPLRDSLFVLKDDGVYRVIGDSPSNLSLAEFDSSTKIAGADTATIGNNQINCLSDQGVVVISDTGISIISRPIENEILPLINNENVSSAAFAVFYQTDRKYILFMPTDDQDSVAQTAWVYNNLTNAWTQWDISKTCGVVNTGSDKLYFGAGDVPNIEIERKAFDRTDFADREYTRTVQTYNSTTKVVRLDSLLNIAVGDVLVQTQTIETPYMDYNVSIECKILEIISVDSPAVRVNSVYDILPGSITHYKAFESNVTWAPESGGDPGILKHYREATLRFKRSRVTQPVLGFDTDLQPGTQEIALIGPGLGTWGYFPWSKVPWGGNLNQRGFRTYIPLGKQYCSIMNCHFKQKAAREDWQLEGLTLTFEVASPRINR